MTSATLKLLMTAAAAVTVVVLTAPILTRAFAAVQDALTLVPTR